MRKIFQISCLLTMAMGILGSLIMIYSFLELRSVK
jgi:hypothetical protein